MHGSGFCVRECDEAGVGGAAVELVSLAVGIGGAAGGERHRAHPAVILGVLPGDERGLCNVVEELDRGDEAAEFAGVLA